MTVGNAPTVAAPQQATQFIEVFYPSNAPHLAPIASRIQAAVEAEIDKVIGDPVRTMGVFVNVAAAARAITAYLKFCAALGEQIGCDTDD